MNTTIRAPRTTTVTDTKAGTFLTGIHNAEVRLAGVLDDWRMRISNFADAKFGADPIHYDNARNTARDMMTKMRLRWRSESDDAVSLSAHEIELMRVPAIAMSAVLIAISDAIKAIQNSSVLSAHAQRALYTMGRVMDAAGVPANLRTMR